MSLSSEVTRSVFGVIGTAMLMTLVLMLSQNAMAKNVLDDPTNFDPTASFRVYNERMGTQSRAEGTIGSKFIFDARLSKDPEGKPLKYAWDFDGDNKYDTDWLDIPTAEKIYYETGVKTIKLMVRDEAGNFDHTTHDLKIVKNTEPSAFFEVEPAKGSPAQEFMFSARLSNDDQYGDKKLEFRWDFDGDKVYDTPWSRVHTVRHVYGYGSKGVYNVTVQVRDPENLRKTYSAPVEILENSVPVAVIDVSPKVGTFETKFTLSAKNSYDDETEFNDLKFRWDTDYNGPNDIIYDYDFKRYGYFRTVFFKKENQDRDIIRVRLEVMDEDGKVATAIAEIKLHWASKYLQYLNDKKIIYTKYDTTFNPDEALTRGEVVEMVVKSLIGPTTKVTSTAKFTDTIPSNITGKYLAYAKEHGIVQGYPDGSFKPDNTISRAEALSIMLRAFDIPILNGGYQLYRDVPTDQWYYPYVDTGTFNELVSGYDTGDFGPHDNITYGEIAKILYQLIHLKELD